MSARATNAYQRSVEAALNAAGGDRARLGTALRAALVVTAITTVFLLALSSVPARGETALVAEARRHLGARAHQLGLPATLWCADFVNFVLRRTGLAGSGGRMARGFASYGRRVAGPQVGAIVVMARGKTGGHVGIVSGIDARGNPIIISGNHGRRVAEAVYPRSRVYAYVVPGGFQ